MPTMKNMKIPEQVGEFFYYSLTISIGATDATIF